MIFGIGKFWFPFTWGACARGQAEAREALASSDAVSLAINDKRSSAAKLSSFEYPSALAELRAKNQRMVGEVFALQIEVDTLKDLIAAKDQSIIGLQVDKNSLRDRLNAAVRTMDDQHAKIANMEMDGPKRDLEKFNDAQAARAMSRGTKQHFQAYQFAIKKILDQLDTLGKSNVVTKEDLRRLRELRIQLGQEIGRTI